jgi:hypothetical protein
MHENKYEGFNQLLIQTDLNQRSTSNKVLSNFYRDLEKVELVNEFKSKSYQRAIARELENLTRTHSSEGFTGSKKALQIAKIIRKHQTLTKDLANLKGAYIPKLDGYITRQMHSRVALKKMGFDKWRDFINPLIDWDKTLIDVSDLERVYKNITSGIHFEALDVYFNISNFSGTTNIANKLSFERKIHFKDADSWFKYNKTCGEYDLKSSVLIEFEKIGKAIGLMENLGTNPENSLVKLKNIFLREMQDDPKAIESIRGSSLDRQLQILMGRNAPENLKLANIGKVARTYKAWCSLGRCLISSIADVMTFQNGLRNNGVPILQAYSKTLTNIVGHLSSKEKRNFGKKLGIFSESLLENAYDRLNPEGFGNGAIAKINTIYYKLNGMHHWDSSVKSAMARVLSNELAENSNKTFNRLDQRLKTGLITHGINEKNWSLIKHFKETHERKNFIIPDSSNIPNEAIIKYLRKTKEPINDLNIVRAKEEIETSIRKYYLSNSEIASPTATSLERDVLNWGTKPGTVIGEFARCAMQFKTHPALFIMKVLKSTLLNRIPPHERAQGFSDYIKGLSSPSTLGQLSELVLGTTLLGYTAIYANKLLEGKNVEPLVETKYGKTVINERMWQAALIKGGGLGLFGDYLFNQYSRYGHNFFQDLAGPIPGDAYDLILSLAEKDTKRVSAQKVLVMANSDNLFLTTK